MSVRRAAGAVIALTLAACAGRDMYRRAGGQLGAAPVRALAAGVLAGTGERLLAVADDGTRRLLLTDQAAWILRGTTVERTAGTRHWIAAGLIAAADGHGTWAVGLDAEGRLWRVRPSDELENITDRYGLGRDRIRALAAAGGHVTAFLLESAVAVADGRRVSRYPAAGAVAIAGGGHQVAVVYANRIERFAIEGAGDGEDSADAGVDKSIVSQPDSAGAPLARRSYALKGVTAAGLDTRGDLFAATADAVYRAEPGEDLHLVYLGDGHIDWLTASGPRAWFADDKSLLLYDDGPTAVVIGDPGVAAKASAGAVAAGDGSLWLVGPSSPAHLVPDRPSTQEARWSETVQPVFARACSACHREGGKAGVDLSTSAAWLAARDEILERTVHRRTMPPGGRTLSEDDRAAISAWVRASGPRSTSSSR